MAHYTTIMNELLNLIPRHRFETIVNNLLATAMLSALTAGINSLCCFMPRPPGKTVYET